MSAICSCASNSSVSASRDLQPGFIGYHVPATEGFVLTAVAVDRDADVDFAAVQLFGGRGQRRFDRVEDHVEFDALCARRHPPASAFRDSSCLATSVRRAKCIYRLLGTGIPARAALEIEYRHQPSFAHFIELEIQRLLILFASQRQAPAVCGRQQPPTVVLATLEGGLQRDLDFLAGKALVSAARLSGRSRPGEDTSSRWTPPLRLPTRAATGA